MKAEKKPKKIKKLKSINLGLWLSFSLFALLIIFLLTLVNYFAIGDVFTGQIRSRLVYIGGEIISAVEHSRPEEDNILDSIVNEFEESENVIIYLISEQGEVIVPFDRRQENVEEIVENLEHRLKGVDINDNLLFNSNGYMNYASRINYGQKCYLLISYKLTLINSTVKTYQEHIFFISIIILLIAFIISYSIAQKLSTPLKSISATAVQMAKGNYDVNFVSAEYQEIAQLSDTLNYTKEEIKKSEIFQKELLANVSHDLKTPLTMIKAYASMIKEISGNNPEKREQHLNVIIDETDRLTGLVNDVLNVSKISSDIDTVNKKVFNLTDYLYGVLNKFDYLRETQGYTFMVDIDADLYTCADEEKIGQAIYNLISNAVNYTGEDKTVYVSLKSDPIAGRIKFSVRDTGEGISKEELSEIWDRYYRSKESHSRPVKGTGLGLHIVKTVLTKHSFEFGVDSKKGYGSTFWIDFPDISAKIDIIDN